MKTFFSSKIARSDDEGDRIGKDKLYELFAASAMSIASHRFRSGKRSPLR